MTGSMARVWGLLVQEAYLTRRSLEIFFDIIFFPLMNVILFGFISEFLGRGSVTNNSEFLLVGILLWEVVSINQYNVSVSTLWSVWSHNLTNIFIAPVSIVEYMTAHLVAAVARTLIVLVVLAAGAQVVFHFNLASVGWLNLVLFVVNLTVFGWWIGIVLLGLIFRFGTRVQAISWGVIFLFQPLTASFFPVGVLPEVLQKLAWALPATYVFEAARAALTDPAVNWHAAGMAAALNLGYFVVAGVVFRRLFRRSRETGQFARNDL